jgi:hypothetical protein
MGNTPLELMVLMFPQGRKCAIFPITEPAVPLGGLVPLVFIRRFYPSSSYRKSRIALTPKIAASSPVNASTRALRFPRQHRIYTPTSGLIYCTPHTCDACDPPELWHMPVKAEVLDA